MNCPSIGELRSHLEQDDPAASRHLQECPRCANKIDQLKRTSDKIAALLGSRTEPVDSVAAYQRFTARHGYVEPKHSFRRPVWLGAAACCLLVLLLSFTPARSWGQRILSMLRVQKVAVVPLDLEALSAATNGREKLLAQMISNSAVVTMKPGEPSAVNDAAAASGAAGFAVTTLDALGTPNRILVRDEVGFQMQLDRDRVLALLDAAGRPDIAVPNNLDGSLIAVHIPKAVEMNYGSCIAKNGAGNKGDECIHFTQVPSPVVSVPPSLNISALAQAVLQVTGMSASEAQAFSQSVDWTSTLVIPIPMHSSSSRPVPVAGVDGTLIESVAQGRRPAEYALIWVKAGRIFAISGAGTPDHALAVAESLN